MNQLNHQRIEFDQYITPNGQVYHFQNYDRCLQSFTGLGMPNFDYFRGLGRNCAKPCGLIDVIYDYEINH